MTIPARFLIIRCRFSDEVNLPAPRPDSYYLKFLHRTIDYWETVSLGQLDFTNSELSPWYTLKKRRDEYLTSGDNAKDRNDLVEWAREAAAAAGSPLHLYRFVIVFTLDFTDLFGGTGAAVVPSVTGPFGVESEFAAMMQEVGHALGLGKHSRAVKNPVDYMDPTCVMSAMTFGDASPPPTFKDPVLGMTGPGVCSPFVDAAGWLPPNGRIEIQVDQGRPRLATFELSPLGLRNAPHPQAAVVRFPSMSIYIEYRSGGYDRMLASQVVVHEFRTDGFPYYAWKSSEKSAAFIHSDLNLSIRVLNTKPENSVIVRVGPAAAARSLSVQTIAAEALGLTRPFSIQQRVIANGSLRDRLLSLVL